MPFPLIPDPDRTLYRRLGVERGPSALLSGSALRAAMAGEAATIRKRSTTRGMLGPVKPTGGSLWPAKRLPDPSRRADHRAQIRTARLRPVDLRRTPRPRRFCACLTHRSAGSPRSDESSLQFTPAGFRKGRRTDRCSSARSSRAINPSGHHLPSGAARSPMESPAPATPNRESDHRPEAHYPRIPRHSAPAPGCSCDHGCRTRRSACPLVTRVACSTP